MRIPIPSALAIGLSWALFCPGAGALAAATAPGACASGRPLPVVAPAGLPVSAALRAVTDGAIASEGGAWNSPLAARLEAPNHSLTLDLGEVRSIRSALIQADADEGLRLDGSLDGLRFEPLAVAPALAGLDGLRSRALAFEPREARFVRVAIEGGDGRASVSEVQLFCVEPAGWRPELRTVRTAPAVAEARPLRWNDETSRWWQLALALLALALLGAERLLPRFATAAGGRLHLAAFVLALATYFNFGAFHFGRFVHNWDFFHYFVGAKYFPELGYERLYDCVAIADAADPAFAARAGERRIRDLRTNALVPVAEAVADPAGCRARFSEGRWRDFESDVAWFRKREHPDRWLDLTADHGFNATPVWMLAGSALANLAPASAASVTALALLDPALLLAAVALLVRAFGWRAATVALLVFSTSFPSRFFWTGGGFLRWDWLFCLVAALALARRGRPFAAGVALGGAALLRLFPAILVAGPAAAAALAAGSAWLGSGGRGWRGRLDAVLVAARTPRLGDPLRCLAGCALAAALLVPASLAFRGGTSTWAAFAVNTAKHAATPLTNNMGLSTVLTYRSDEVGRRLVSADAAEPWAPWKAARLAARHRMRPFQLFLATAAVAALLFALSRRGELWIALALASCLVPLLVEMTCYYYAFLIVPALLAGERREVGPILLALSAAGQFLSLAPLPGMPTWRDEIYTWISLVTVVALGAILVRFARSGRAVPAT